MLVLIIVIIIIWLIGLGFLVLWYLHSRSWPATYTLTNEDTKTVNVNVLHNGTELVRSPIRLLPKQSVEIKLGYDTAINPRTNKQISRSETKSTAIYLPENNKMSIKPSKNFPDYRAVISVDNSGLIPIENNPSLTWSEKGYYYINFYDGIPTFSS